MPSFMLVLKNAAFEVLSHPLTSSISKDRKQGDVYCTQNSLLSLSLSHLTLKQWQASEVEEEEEKTYQSI